MQTKPTLIPKVPADTLPEHRQKQYEAGLASFQHVLAERDHAERKWNEAVVKIAELEQKLASLDGIVTMMESTFASSKVSLEQRVREYQKERDLAVAKNARLEAILSNCANLLNTEMQLNANAP